MNRAEEKLLLYAEKNLEKEKDKWESGMKNSYTQWEDLVGKLKEMIEEDE